MKKKKSQFRKVKNKPKSQRPGKKKDPTLTDVSAAGAQRHPAEGSPDQGMDVMSQVILDFAAPLLATCDDLDAEKKAISLSIFVWNSSLLPEPLQKTTLTAYLDQCEAVLPAQELETLKGYIDQLLQDKAQRYADNRNRITNCTFGDYKGDRHIEVGYMLST